MEKSSERSNRLIAVVEDNEDIRSLEVLALNKEGYAVHSYGDGKSFLADFAKDKPDLVILDLMLPDIQGEEILKEIRKDPDNAEVQVIIVSAKTMLTDKVLGLDSGADDYIEKPFDILEFLARVNARFRNVPGNKKMEFAGLTLDPEAHEAFFKGSKLRLTNAEFAILKELIAKGGSVVSRQHLIQVLWGHVDPLTTRTIDMHIRSIRLKIDDREGKLLQTVYGIGYRLAEK